MNPIRIVDRWLALPWRGLIAVYRRLISPVLPGACRFEPSCSCYADEAFARWGFVRGFGLTVWRICRCQPFARAGWDPVPELRHAPTAAVETPSAPSASKDCT